ncbi:MAG TPA: hypothetical protein P5527_01805 [Kiritimatiellia bacterium]|nr:hypothetical protein [Kiritimatiellia bacterium]
MMDPGDPGLGLSRGVFLSRNGWLWVVHGAYRGTVKDVAVEGRRAEKVAGKRKKLLSIRRLYGTISPYKGNDNF